MTRRIEIVLTDSQYADLAERADAAGQVLSQWAASILLGCQQYAVKDEVVEEEVIEDEEEFIDDGLVDSDDPLAVRTETVAPSGATKVERLYEVLPAWRGDTSSHKRLKSFLHWGRNGEVLWWGARPGSIFIAYLGTKQIQVGRGIEGKVVWGETLPWDRAHRAATLDLLQTLATRDLAPKSWAWRDEDDEE